MDELLADIVAWTELQSPGVIYLGLFAVAYLENVLPPVPGDLLIVLCGYLAATGTLDLLPVIVIATVGGTAGFMTMFQFGRHLGDRLLAESRYRWIPRHRLKKATNWFTRVGFRLVLANRFLTGLRSVISLAVGMSNTDSLRTLMYSALSSLAWVVLLAYLGFELGENWILVKDYMSRYGQLMTVAIVLFIVVQFSRYWLSIKKGGTGHDIGS